MTCQWVQANLGWAQVISDLSGGSGNGSGSGSGSAISGKEGSSSSAIRRKILEPQRWLLWNFSSQLKQRSCSRRRVISSGERRFILGGAGRPGGGNNGGRDGVVKGVQVELGAEEDGFGVSCKKGKVTWKCATNVSILLLIGIPSQECRMGKRDRSW